MAVLTMLLDIARYVALCAVLVLCGVGTLRLFRAAVPHAVALLLAPAITQALWACVLGLSVVTGHPVRTASVLTWVMTLGFAVYGTATMIDWGRRGAELDRRAWYLLGASAGVTALVLLPHFVFGLSDYVGSGRLDGWGYITYGQYLWSYPRGTEGGLAPLYQWASHLSHTRHIASAQLGLLSVLATPGETQPSLGLFLSGALFSYASACAALAYTRVARGAAFLYLVVAVACGWSLNVVWADNLDNALALVYLPAFAAMTALSERFTIGTWAVFGMMAAGMLYTYPEFAPLTTVALGLLTTERLVRHRHRGGPSGALLAVVVCIVWLSPYLAEFVAFIRAQMSMGLQPGVRPGSGYFPGLLASRYQLSAVWGLGGEFSLETGLLLRNLAAAALSVLFLLGVVCWFVQRRLALVAICGLFVLAAAVMIGRDAYDYGAYKMLLLGWWIIAFATVTGVVWLASLPRAGRLAARIGVAACLAIPALAVTRSVEAVATKRGVSIKPYRTATMAVRLVRGQPIAVLVDDLLASHWAVYFLRDTPIRLHAGPGGYLTMPHVLPLLARSQSVPWEATRFVLRDAVERDPFYEQEGWSLVSGVGAYGLWDTQANGWAVVADARNPNGFESLRGQSFFWMGGGGTELNVLAQRAGRVELSAEFGPGPSVAADIRARRLLIQAGGQASTLEILASGRRAISLPLNSGENRVTLTALDRPTAGAILHRDPRPMILSVYQPRLRVLPTDPSAASGREARQ